MSNKTNTTDVPEYCECGHRKEEHIAGHKECTVSGCGCQAFHLVHMGIAKKRVCVVCAKEYSCSHPMEDRFGVCNICTKQIEDNYQGDLIDYLFGYRDSQKTKLLAKLLAMKIKAAGTDIPAMWEFWCQGHPQTTKPE